MNIASMIDHTNLKQDATLEQIQDLCGEAKRFSFASVCVNSSYVPICKSLLEGTGIPICTVVGFPLGAMSTLGKVMETRKAILDGATEIDMVIHVGMVKNENWDYVAEDISAVVNECSGRALVKVIIETCLLTEEEKERVCEIAKEAGADFVKTSTGFSTGGATVEDIALMRHVVGTKMGVKASGGIRTIEDVKAMIEAGASRIGTSAGVTMVE